MSTLKGQHFLHTFVDMGSNGDKESDKDGDEDGVINSILTQSMSRK